VATAREEALEEGMKIVRHVSIPRPLLAPVTQGRYAVPLRQVARADRSEFFDSAVNWPWHRNRRPRPANADVLADGALLPFRPESLDYIASSHLLEHLPNPIAALDNWYRALKPGGLIYLVVPDRRFTFDHLRARTPLQHLIEDFEHGTTAVDGTHIDEFSDRVDMARFMPGTPEEEWPALRESQRASQKAAVSAGLPINIHFHVFEKEDVLSLLQFTSAHAQLRHQWEVISVRERYPPNRGDGFLVVARALKEMSWRSAARSVARRLLGFPRVSP
jgi:SAM-dependent methyltransferase